MTAMLQDLRTNLTFCVTTLENNLINSADEEATDREQRYKNISDLVGRTLLESFVMFYKERSLAQNPDIQEHVVSLRPLIVRFTSHSNENFERNSQRALRILPIIINCLG